MARRSRGIAEPVEKSVYYVFKLRRSVGELVKFKPTPSVADMLNRIKAKSSKWLNEQTPKQRFAWQQGYAALTVSESQAPTIRRYIQNQQTHHRRLSYQEEFLKLLDKHGIEYDELYVWA